ncbi:WD repeat and SOCS box-containing protein 2 isoform X2 [Notechis scutatus]|uniref:WD repeat and SOCS box-containing protein 2 isoform X2 n=1 Tax=Notechis scutatus TaxID=8663 RepID=A0A6J1VA55_9SAUR|nr:WD repeat and SOCS box-containing protein 2 isoform X2 [Notechis scutatus]
MEAAAPGEGGRPRLLRPPVGEAVAEGEPLLVAELKPRRPQQHDWKSSCETWSVAFSADGTWFAWSQGHCVVRLLPWPLQRTEHNSKALEPKNRCAKTKAKGYGGTKEKTLECGQIVWGLAFSSWLPSQSHKYRHRKETFPCLILATGLHDGQIKVWEVETGKQLKVLSGHLQWVYGCSISPDGQMLCSVAGEKSALLWSMNSYCLLRKLEGHQGCIASCDFSPDSALLATASYDTCVILWDPYTGEKLRSLWHVPLQPAVDQGGNFHTSSLRSVCFSPEGLYLATVADDRLLRIWALELESPVAFAPVKNGLCCTYFPHGGIIATGTRDGHAQFWTAPQALSSLKHLCRKVLRGCFTSYQVQALSIPKKMKEFLTYRTL